MTTGTWIPTPPDLDDAPELAVLTVLELALRVAESAILAAWPHLVGTDPPTEPPERVAAAILGRAWHLRRAVAAYRDLVADRLDGQRPVPTAPAPSPSRT